MPPKRKGTDAQATSTPTAASASSPASDAASSPAPTTKKAQQRNKRQKLQQEMPPHDITFPFSESLDLNDIQQLPTHEWTPATDKEIAEAVERSAKYSEDAERARVRGTNYDIQNVKKLDLNLDWWDWDWKYQDPPEREITRTEEGTLRKLQSGQGIIKGQTIVHTVSATFPGNELSASMLGFASLAAFYTWIDSQGTDFFADLEHLRLDNWHPHPSTPSYVAIPGILSERAKHSGVHRILEAISTIESRRTFYIRNGDVESAWQPVEARNNTHLAATILANVLVALMFTTTGPDSDDRRFVRVDGEEGNRTPYYYGYHADKWLAMIQGGVNLFHFRRRPDTHYIVDRKPQGTITGVPTIDPPGSIREYNDMRHRRLGHFFTAMARLLMVLPEELQNRTDDLVLCVSSLAQEFEKLDKEHVCYKEPSAKWIKEMLDKHAEAHKNVLVTSRPSKRSQKYKDYVIDVDSDDSADEDGESGLEVQCQKKEDDTMNVYSKLEMVMNLETLRDLGKLAAALPNADRPLAPRGHVCLKDEREAFEIEQRKRAAMSQEDAPVDN